MELEQKIIASLVATGKITAEIAEEVRLTAINSGSKPTDILLSKHLISEDDILAAKAQSMNMSFVTLEGRGISPEILNYIPEPVARKYKLMPFDLDKKSGKLFVAMIDPLDLPLIEFLEQKSGKPILSYLAKESDIVSKIEEEYSQGLAVDVSEALKESAEPVVKTIEASQISKIIKEAPIAKIVSTILEYAVKSRASDVHIEAQEARTRVRYRIDGILHEKLALPRSVHDAVVSRIKILSDMKKEIRP